MVLPFSSTTVISATATLNSPLISCGWKLGSTSLYRNQIVGRAVISRKLKIEKTGLSLIRLTSRLYPDWMDFSSIRFRLSFRRLLLPLPPGGQIPFGQDNPLQDLPRSAFHQFSSKIPLYSCSCFEVSSRKGLFGTVMTITWLPYPNPPVRFQGPGAVDR